MSIALEFIDFIVPIALIKQKYPGGWNKFLDDHGYALGKRVWYDEHLVRDGAMSPADIDLLIDEWTNLGFQPFAELNGKEFWKDCCVVDGYTGKPTLPCDWIVVDSGTAYLKGTEPGCVAGRTSNESAETDMNFSA